MRYLLISLISSISKEFHQCVSGNIPQVHKDKKLRIILMELRSCCFAVLYNTTTNRNLIVPDIATANNYHELGSISYNQILILFI